MATLILNADATPVSVLPLSISNWRDAVKMYFLERADIISSYDIHVRSENLTLAVPKIMLSREYIQPPKAVKFTKDNLLLRDEFCCQYCDFKDVRFNKDNVLTMDHVKPRKDGGMTTWDNIALCCRECNARKGHRTDMKPRKAPHRPSYYQLAATRKNFPVQIADPEWIPFIDWVEDDKIILIPPQFDFDKTECQMLF